MDQVDLLVMCRVRGVSWNFLAREAQRPDGMERLRAGRAAEESPEASKSLAALATARDDIGERQRIVEGMLEGTEADGIQLTTVLDEDYPVNLRTIFNLPPFLFYNGDTAPRRRAVRRGRRDTAGKRGRPEPGRADGAPSRRRRA